MSTASSKFYRPQVRSYRGLLRGLVTATVVVLFLLCQTVSNWSGLSQDPGEYDLGTGRQLLWFSGQVVETNSTSETGSETSASAGETCDKIPHSNACAYVQANCPAESLIDYSYIYYCQAGNLKPLVITCYVVYLVLLFVLLGSTAEDYFCPTLSVISEALHMSPDLAGITILALGNGAPDVFSTLVAVKGGGFSIAIGELIGAGNFVTEVVVGTVSLFSVCSVQRLPLLRDVCFYLLAVFFVALCLLTKKILYWQSLLFLGVYICYVSFSAFVNYIRLRREAKLKQHTEEPDAFSLKDPSSYEQEQDEQDAKEYLQSLGLLDEDPRPVGNIQEVLEEGQPWFIIGHSHPNLLSGDYGSIYVNRPLYVSLGLLPARARFHLDSFCGRIIDYIEWDEKTLIQRIQFVLLAPFVFVLNASIPFAEEWHRMFACLNPLFSGLVFCVALELYDNSFYGIPIVAIIAVAGAAIGLIMWVTTHYDYPPRYRPAFVALGFLMSIVWIYVLANELVALLKTWGLIIGISQGVLGLTVLAWGNSIGDMISNIVVARQGFPSMAIAACFGGPLFNLLVGLGISVSYMNFRYWPQPYEISYEREIEIAFIFLTISLVSTLVFVPLNNFYFSKKHAVLLYVIYASLTVVGLLAQLGFLNLPALPRL